MTRPRRRPFELAALLLALLPLLGACGLAPTPIATLPSPPGAPAPSPTPPSATRAWSDPAGWPGGALPGAGDSVAIPPGEVVLLDVSPPPLGGLAIDGALVFDRRDLELRAAWILVHGGLYIGSAAAPFAQRAVVTLTGAPGEHDVHGMGGKVLGVMGGVVALHGAAPGPSWTRLVEHGAVGASQLRVEDATGWAPGDRIVVASTDFEAWEGARGSLTSRDRQVEERTLIAVQGTTLTLDRPLDFAHVGRAEVVDGVRLDARAEVLRLTRRIVVRGDEGSGDPASDRYGFGGHLMAMGDAILQLHGVEFHRMGQLGELGRYPIHWHLMGDRGRASALTRSSIHGTFNRCVTIHGTNDVWVEDVAAYDAVGHCYFLEDAAETGNVLYRNAALMIRKPADDRALLASDVHHLGPAAFWITHPDNVLIGNVAASSQGTGFWYALPEHPTGPSYDLFDGASTWPRRTPLGRFAANVAHSNATVGLHVDNGPTADLAGLPPTSYRPRSAPADVRSPPVPALFEDFVAYKQRRAGAWFRGDHSWLRGGVLADNAVGVTFASNASGAERVAFVGESANVGTPRSWEATGLGGRALPRYWDPGYAIRGFEFYDGEVTVRDSTFVGFVPNGIRQASALAYLDFTAFSVDPANAAAALRFGPDTNRVYLASRSPAPGEPADGYRSALFRDLDGSVGGTPDRTVTVNTPLLTAPGCSYRADWNAQVCPGRYASLALDDATGAAGLSPVLLQRDDGATHPLIGTPSALSRFRSNVRLDHGHAFEFAAASDHLRLHLQGVGEGDAMVVALPWLGDPPFVYRDWWIDERNLLPWLPGLAALHAAANAGAFHDGATLHLRLAVQPGRDYAQVEVCRTAGCP